MKWSEDQLADYQRRRGVPGAEKNRADTSRPPFALPPDPFVGGIVVDLPPPISVNSIWRKTKAGVSKSKDYQRWIARADAMLLELGQLKGVKPIVGPFAALIVVKRCNLDLDNCTKAALDFMQNRNFIVNDKLAEEIILRWGDAPTGMRVTLRAWV